ncbi:MAG: DUF1592 domain-containing protein [Planctomycetes bacterium]|nr:DUF1592 domain-containing protein [Planctomycetota bacterium]
MRKTHSLALLAAAVCSQLVQTAHAQVRLWPDSVKTLIQSHCSDCHQGEDAEAGLDLDSLSNDLADKEVTRRWTLIHDRIARGEMPPSDSEQLPVKVKADVLADIAGAISRADNSRRDVVLRRLNRVEYENTVRDLFDVYVRVKELLPEDTPSAGFDNVGEGLAVSPEAMHAYLRAADATLDAVFGPPKQPKYLKHETNLLDQLTWLGQPQLADQIGKMFRKTDDGLVIFQSGYCPTNLVNFSRLRAPAGTYRGTIRVRAIQSAAPVTLRIYGGDTIVGRREKHLVGYYDVPPNEWTTIEFTDRLVQDGGTFQPKCYGTRDTRKDADTYPEPGIEIGDITIEGPLEAWPPRSRGKLLGDVDPTNATLEDARNILRELLPKAYRRPTTVEEAEDYVGLVESALTVGRSFEESLRFGLKAVLCSPEFLFLDEPTQDQFVSQFAIASRLSYFLWSSMPDVELTACAARNDLSDPQVLRQQTERMLGNSRAKAFTTNFTGQWLDLRDIDFTEPDANLYPEFDELLRVSMIEETTRFFQEVLDQDLNVMTFLDSDFTVLNERLAKHYGVTGVVGQAYRKVTLPKDSVRGGLLTQASILKVTANGTNTSPVLRGAWVREKLLGLTVPPPPNNVSAVEPDIRGATTLREQLTKHRDVESCASCHDKIDPPGFALENFDPIGGWRDNYRTMREGRRPDFSQSPFTYAWIRYRIGLPVDASGTTPSGGTFDSIVAYKKLLAGQSRQITKGLTEKLLTYATGRELQFSDRAAVEQIVEHVSQKNYGFRALIHEVVESEIFKQP